MIPDKLSELLTAYIDGELSGRQTKAVQRLLRKSSEARSLLHQLQENARALRGLPRSRLDQDLSQRVLRSIHERNLKLARRAALTERPPFPAWAGYMAAASVLLAVFFGSYLYFYASYNPNQQTATQTEPKQNTDPLKTHPTPEPERNPVVENILAPKPDDPTPETPKPESVVVDKSKKPDAKTPPPVEVKVEDVQTDRSPKSDSLKDVDATMAFNLLLRDLDQEKSRTQLRGELEKSSAFRLEVVCLGNHKVFERLETAFNAQGIRVLVDRFAQDCLKNRQPTDFVLYVEDLTPEEATRIFEKIGLDDKKAASAKASDAQFGQAYVLPLSAEDHQKLSEKLIGVKASKLDPPQKRVDIHKPISSTTAQQLDQAPPRPEPGKPVAKVALTKQSLLLSYEPRRVPPEKSQAIQSFLRARTPRRPGTVQILLVLRGVSG